MKSSSGTAAARELAWAERWTSDVTITVQLPPLHAKQLEIKRQGRRFNVCSIGRRFGKTVLGLDLASNAALLGHPVGWFAPNYKYLDDPWHECLKTLRPVVRTIDKQQHRIHLMTGGVIDFWTLDDPDAGRSRKYKRVIVDEAAMARHLQQAWEQSIRPTLTDLKGDAWFLSTPKGLNYYHELSQRVKTDPEKWATFQMASVENPHLDPDEIEEARQSLPEIVFRQEYLGEFVDSGGTLLRREHIVKGRAPGSFDSVGMGVDLAISVKEGSDYTAIVVSAFDVANILWFLDAYRVRGTFREVLDLIWKVGQKAREQWGLDIVSIEKVQYQAAVVQEVLANTDLPVKGVVPDKDKVTRFYRLQSMHEQGMVRYDEGVPDWFIDEMLSFPLGQHDDGVDAAVYSTLRPEQKKIRIRAL